MTLHKQAGAAIATVRDLLPESFTCVDMGTQTLTFRIPDLPEVKTTEQYYAMLGCDDYDTIDLDFSATIYADLNLPFHYGKEYDLVVNNGTGEHIFDQANLFYNMHHLCKKGGIILCVLPWINWLNHGFYSVHPALFRDLANANDYEIVLLYAGDRDRTCISENLTFDEIKKPHPVDKNIFIICGMRKLTNGPFRRPQQRKYTIKPPDVLDHIETLHTTPFPYFTGHVDMKNLSETFKCEFVHGDHGENNKLFQANASQLLIEENLTADWRAFIEYYTSTSFLQKMLSEFEISSRYPEIKKLDLTAGVRFLDSAPFLMDCQWAINTEVLEKSTVRGPHVDDPREVYAGMIYLTDGCLELYKWLDKPQFVGRKDMKKAAECAPGSVEKVDEFRHKRGDFIFFLNGIDSIHGVEEREPTNELRKYVNIICETEIPLFEL